MSKTPKIIYLSLALASCHNQGQKTIVLKSSWQEIQIITRTQKITIEHYDDSATFEERHYLTSPGKRPVSSDTNIQTMTNFALVSVERDSLYEYVLDLITNPTFTDKNATDYAGYVRVKLIDRNTTLTCEYKGA